MSDFEWQIEDDETRASAELAPGLRFRRGCWIAALGVGIVIPLAAIAALLAIQSEVHRRREESLAGVRRDIAASHALAQRAAAHGDIDLFSAVLLDEPGWSRSQKALFERGLIGSRAPLNLATLLTEPPGEEVRLSGDGKTAEIITEQAYTDGETAQVVRYQHRWFYRFDGERWRLSPPQADFWGNPVTRRGQSLTLIYPANDRATSERLLRDLDALFAGICREPGVALCPTGTPLFIQFATQTSSLANLLDPDVAAVLSHGQRLSITLPSPAVFGAPLDEAAYQALYRRYAVHIVDILIHNRRFQLEVENSGWYQQAAHDRLLTRYGLRVWPPASLEAASDAQAIPLPRQDIAAYCVEDFERGGPLYLYSTATDTWSEALSSRIVSFMNPLPDRSGVVLQEQIAGSRATRLTLWRNGREQVLFAPPPGGASASFTGKTDPSVTRMVVNLQIGSGNAQPGVLRLHECNAAGCPWQTTFGYLSWSPSGARTLVTGLNTGSIWLGDAQGEPIEEIGPGLGAFWQDDNTYGYLASTGAGAEPNIVTRSIDGGETSVAVDTIELLRRLPADRRLDLSRSSYWGYDTGDANWVLIEAVNQNPSGDDTNYLLLVHKRRGALVWQQLNSETLAHEFSPDGRWLAVTTGRGRTGWTLHVFDLERSTEALTFDAAGGAVRVPFPYHDWSSDGQWLLALDGGVIHLFAPEHDIHRTLIPESPGCAFALWINRGS